MWHTLRLQLMIFVAAVLTLVLSTTDGVFGADGQPDFLRDIRPILARHCWACHGPDAAQRKADLRLDTREGLFAIRESGQPAVRPLQPANSLILIRIRHADPEQRMPPVEANSRPADREIEMLVRWIESGARYEDHWALRPITLPPLPTAGRSGWAQNPIDRFVASRAEQQGMSMSLPAERAALHRRLHLTILGVPPSPEQLTDFIDDPSPDAYDRAVEQVFSSPRYGERMAVWWLDLARYADTHGYHTDSHRDMWRWRDWVIASFNRNLPFDQFTLEQLAGDLLPNATVEQRIATGFNRNNMINFENGALADEYLVEYAVDRVVTTSTVWLAQTFQCARCHDHKYDPISQRDFYQIFAFFNQVPEKGLDGEKGNAAPILAAPTDLQRDDFETAQHALADTNRRLAELLKADSAEQEKWEQEVRTREGGLSAPPNDAEFWLSFEQDQLARRSNTTNRFKIEVKGELHQFPGRVGQASLLNDDVEIAITGPASLDQDTSFSVCVWVWPATKDDLFLIGSVVHEPTRRGWEIRVANAFPELRLMHDGLNGIIVRGRVELPLRKWKHLSFSYDGSGRGSGVRLYVDGQSTKYDIVKDSLEGSLSTVTPIQIGREPGGDVFRGLVDELQFFRRELSQTEVLSLSGADPVRDALQIPPESRTVQQRQSVRHAYLEQHDTSYRRLIADAASLEAQLAKIRQTSPTTMVMAELSPRRATRILGRGRYDRPGEFVEPAPPMSLFSSAEKLQPNRLGLARWIVADKNPLPARVVVNRLWEMAFGVGLVSSSENFGTRGELPSHPELLDWLAFELIRSNWNLRHVQRLIVSSATFQQASRRSPAEQERDPLNRWLARGPRQRLAAEFVRDNALQIAGLLQTKMGGPGARPYQPPGLWEEVSYDPDKFTAQVFIQDHRADLYRRGVYTFWKRSVPPPALAIFDAPEREVCTVSRSRTNSVLQALVLMNDPQYVEAARAFAERILSDNGDGLAAPARTTREEAFGRRLENAFRIAVARLPSKFEVSECRSVFQAAWTDWQGHPAERDQFLSVGELARDSRLDPTELAAWAVVANVILSLDETISVE